MSWLLLLKTLHVLSAITAAGANLTYAVWGRQAAKEREHLGFALRGIKAIDDRVATPAYGVLLVTGLIMAFTTYTITTRWILTGIAFYIVLAALGTGVYAPTLRRQIAALDSDGPDSPAYSVAAARARGVGLFIVVLLLVVVGVMVFKPTY